ncbi:MAG: M56 family metallopeptidase [Saprospiraceae bacterium]|nr:M56 family metallopeptidase [Saprospiraceae bacterium]
MHPTEFLPQLSEVLGWTILHSLWQGSLIYLLLQVCLRLLRKRSSSHLRYLLLSGALLSLFSWVALTFYQKTMEVFGSHPMPLPTSGLEPISSFETVLTLEGGSGWWSDLWWRAELFMQMYADQLAYFWLVGVLFFSLRWIGGFYFTYRLRRVGTLAVPEAWEKQVQQLSIQLGVRKPVKIMASMKVQVPLVVGHLKPIILLPFGMLANLSPAQLEAILLHELAHVRRHDFLINLMLSILEILLFYHPVFWLLSNRILEERELCCDDIAVANCGNPRLYARTLLLMEEQRQQLTLAMSYQGKKQHLMDRIKRICLQTPTPSTSTSTKAGLALLLLLGMAVVSWANLPAFDSAFDNLNNESSETITTTQEAELTTSSMELKEETMEDLTSVLPSNTEETIADPLTMDEADPFDSALKTIATSAPQSVVSTSNSDATTAADLLGAMKMAAPNMGMATSDAQKIRKDTVPPRIPKMSQTPDLPTPPDFSVASKEISSALKGKDGDRSKLRATIDRYTTAIDEWQGAVNEQYLSQWNDRREEIKLAYKDWLGQLKTEYGNDMLSHSLALQKGSRSFEDKLNEHERAINLSEETLNKSLEDRIRKMEDGIRKFEDKQAEHRERMEYHRDRMSLHGLRMSIHHTRMDLHRERMNLHRDRMDIHRDRMDAHREIMDAFKKEFYPALIKDGFIKNEEDDIAIRAKGNSVRVNGKELPAQQAQKYLKMIRKYGFEIPDKGEWIYERNGKSQTFGTSTKSSSREE